MVRCRVCEGTSHCFADELVMGRHRVRYYRCASCGFVQTEEPFWLEAAYGEAITAGDVGLVRRNLRIATVTRLLLTLLFDPAKKFIDYGGGYGLFVRLMRDAGYDFRRFDPHCDNIFARGFDATLSDAPFELLTAFEVFEHLPDPVAATADMLRFSDSIFFTTELSAAAACPAECGYYGLEHGQHVSFFTLGSLRVLAERHGLRLYSDGRFRHLLTPRRLPRPLFVAASTHRLALLLSPFTARPSLVEADAAMATGGAGRETEERPRGARKRQLWAAISRMKRKP